MANVQFLGKDQIWTEEATIYWFRVSGSDHKSGIEFNGDDFGVRESGPESRLLDEEGAPLCNENIRLAVERLCVVTDEMRAAQ